MGLVSVKCTQCGANIEIDENIETGYCPSCGTKYITKNLINNNYTVNNYYVNQSSARPIPRENAAYSANELFERYSAFMKMGKLGEAFKTLNILESTYPQVPVSHIYKADFLLPADGSIIQQARENSLLNKTSMNIGFGNNSFKYLNISGVKAAVNAFNSLPVEHYIKGVTINTVFSNRVKEGYYDKNPAPVFDRTITYADSEYINNLFSMNQQVQLIANKAGTAMKLMNISNTLTQPFNEEEQKFKSTVQEKLHWTLSTISEYLNVIKTINNMNAKIAADYQGEMQKGIVKKKKKIRLIIGLLSAISAALFIGIIILVVLH